MKTKIVIYADEGKVLTDGNVFGRQIFLGDGRTANEFYEITDEEYLQYQAEKQYYTGDNIYFESEKYICIAPEGIVCDVSPKDCPDYWEKIVKETV